MTCIMPLLLSIKKTIEYLYPFYIQAHDTLEDKTLEPVSCDNAELISEALEELNPYRTKNQRARELYNIIANPHFKVRPKIENILYSAAL